MKTKSIFLCRLKTIVAIFKVIILRFLSLFIVNKRYWVIMERGVDARDNAYFFYKFMKKEHPEQKIYYIIDKNSSDYSKVKEDAIQYQSIKSYLIIFAAQKYFKGSK